MSSTPSSAIDVAVTGIGMVTSIGASAAATFAAMCAGQSGLKPLQRFDRTRFGAQAAYEIAQTEPGADRPLRASLLLTDAIGEALASSASTSPPASLPCFIGTGLRELRSVELWWKGQAAISPERLHFGPVLRETFPSIGHVDTLTNACSASLFALASAVDAVRLGETDRAVVGGVDILTESMFGLLDRVQMTPPDCVRPFDRDRIGVLMGEGAAAIIVERLDAARARNATIHGVIKGVGLSCDAHHETAPNPPGMARAISTALEQAHVDPAAVGFIMAHGTGTSLNDKAEYAALETVFGSTLGTIPITGIKSMTGHTSGASGLVGLITAMLALANRRIPPTLGHRTPMDGAEAADIVTQTRHIGPTMRALVNAFGFGEVNACVVVEREVV